VATTTLVGLALDGSEAVGGEDAGIVSTENATATFTQTPSGVTLRVELTGCDVGQSYPIDIHAGRSCKNVTTQGEHWDGLRGIEIPELVCGADRTVLLNYTRANSDPVMAWTVGDGRATDVVGHVLIVHGPYDDRTLRASCGVIE
jgi:Cu/Zn superoxide dismutase